MIEIAAILSAVSTLVVALAVVFLLLKIVQVIDRLSVRLDEPQDRESAPVSERQIDE